MSRMFIREAITGYKLVTGIWNKIYHTPTGEVYFNHRGVRYDLSNFVYCHNNPWVNDTFPEFIHAYDATDNWNPLFLEINKGGDFVRLYYYIGK